jgi:hypothetical protein
VRRRRAGAETQFLLFCILSTTFHFDLLRSGKTAAFGLPVIQAVAETLSRTAAETSVKTASTPGEKKPRPVICMSSDDKDALFVVEGARCRGTSDAKFVGGRATVGVKGAANHS